MLVCPLALLAVVVGIVFALTRQPSRAGKIQAHRPRTSRGAYRESGHALDLEWLRERLTNAGLGYPQNPTDGVVLHLEASRESLERRSAPSGAHVGPCCALSLEHCFFLPDSIDTLVVAAGVALSKAEESRYLDVLRELDGDGQWHALLGHPRPVQGDVRLECVPRPDHGAPDEEQSRAALDWQLLVQLGSDDAADWLWGDCGSLYVMIHRDDLESRAWGRAQILGQCT